MHFKVSSSDKYSITMYVVRAGVEKQVRYNFIRHSALIYPLFQVLYGQIVLCMI